MYKNISEMLDTDVFIFKLNKIVYFLNLCFILHWNSDIKYFLKMWLILYEEFFRIVAFFFSLSWEKNLLLRTKKITIIIINYS